MGFTVIYLVIFFLLPPPQHNKILCITTKSFTVRISKVLSKQQDTHAMNKCKQTHKVGYLCCVHLFLLQGVVTVVSFQGSCQCYCNSLSVLRALFYYRFLLLFYSYGLLLKINDWLIDWTNELDLRKQIDVIDMDFEKKAFDKVLHYRLTSKLKSYGLADALVNWISTFLCDRN